MTIKEFNPYRHLTEARTLSPDVATSLLASLNDADRATIEYGGYVKIGAAWFWSPERTRGREG